VVTGREKHEEFSNRNIQVVLLGKRKILQVVQVVQVVVREVIDRIGHMEMRA